MIDRIVVSRTEEDGELGAGAIEVAAELARVYDAELVLVSHASPPDLRQVLDPHSSASPHEADDAAVAGISRRFPAVRARVRRVAGGDPVKTVMSMAIEEKADLIVMGNLVEAPVDAEDGASASSSHEALAAGHRHEVDIPGASALPGLAGNPPGAPLQDSEPSTPTRQRRARGGLRAFYSDRLGWAAVFTTSFLLAYGGGAVLFWLHAIYRGEHGPAISDWSHWLLDSTLGFVALTPILFFILPASLWILARRDGSRRVRLWSYVAVVGTMFTLVTGPGPLLHNSIAGHGTWLADLATAVFGHSAATAERNMHAMEHSQLTEGLLQIAVGLPVYVALAWLALRLVGAMTARRSTTSGESAGGSAMGDVESHNETEADRDDH